MGAKIPCGKRLTFAGAAPIIVRRRPRDAGRISVSLSLWSEGARHLFFWSFAVGHFAHLCPQLEQTHITSLEPRPPATRPAPPARIPPRTAPPRLKPFLTNWMLVPPHLGQRRRAASVFSTMSGSKRRFCFADGSIAALSGSFGVMLPAFLAIFVPGDAVR